MITITMHPRQRERVITLEADGWTISVVIPLVQGKPQMYTWQATGHGQIYTRYDLEEILDLIED